MLIYEISILGNWNDLLLFSQLWDLYTGNQPTENEVEQLIKDVENYTLASHLFWGLWGIISVLIISTLFSCTSYMIKILGSSTFLWLDLDTW